MSNLILSSIGTSTATQIHFSSGFTIIFKISHLSTLNEITKIFVYVGQGSQKSNNFSISIRQKGGVIQFLITNEIVHMKPDSVTTFYQKRRKILLTFLLKDKIMSSQNQAYQFNALILTYNFFQQSGSKMTFVQSAIPLFSALLGDCELGMTQLDILSNCFPKFSQKTLKFALQKLKEELEETEEDVSERKRKLNLVNGKKFQITLGKLRERLQIQKEQLPKLIAQQKSQKDNTSLKDILGDIDFFCTRQTTEKTPLKQQDHQKPYSLQVYNSEKNYIYSSKSIEQTEQEMELMDYESALFLR